MVGFPLLFPSWAALQASSRHRGTAQPVWNISGSSALKQPCPADLGSASTDNQPRPAPVTPGAGSAEVPRPRSRSSTNPGSGEERHPWLSHKGRGEPPLPGHMARGGCCLQCSRLHFQPEQESLERVQERAGSESRQWKMCITVTERRSSGCLVY